MDSSNNGVAPRTTSTTADTNMVKASAAVMGRIPYAREGFFTVYSNPNASATLIAPMWRDS